MNELVLDTESVAPARLHRLLDRAQGIDAEERKAVLGKVLDSGILAVIRRVPETMSPLSNEEKELVAQWAEKKTGDDDVSNRDFAFHLMANCKVPANRVLGILEENRTFSRSALDHVKQIFGTDDPVHQLNNYLGEVADELIKSDNIRSRDRARHMYITLSKDTGQNWFLLGQDFSMGQVHDLRQGVIERFLAECPEGNALMNFAENVVKMCLGKIGAKTGTHPVRFDVTMMHWVFMCLQRIGDSGRLAACAHAFRDRFLYLPRSIAYKVDSAMVSASIDGVTSQEPIVLPKPAPVEPPPMVSLAPWKLRNVRPIRDVSVRRSPEPPAKQSLTPWRPKEAKPILVIGGRETNAQIAERLGITKEEVIRRKKNGQLKS